MKKFNSSKKIIIAIVLAIIIILLVSLSVMQRDNEDSSGPVQSVISDLVATVDQGLSYPVRAIERSIQSVSNLLGTYEENGQLKKRLDSYASMQSENEILQKENKELRDQLELQATLTTNEKIVANVITRSPDDWQDILIIDRGQRDGIEVNMPVMGSSGLIGRVIVVNDTSAKVELLTSTNQNSNHFPVMITPDGEESVFGLMASYSEEESALVVKQLTSVKGVKKGDKVLTSGLGTSSPKGLMVGTVSKVEPTSFGLEQEVYVSPASSLYDISVVTVVKRVVGSGE
ncbi:rod shape-determining protein MreC [Vagococcus elongatus]|uniref:Cell shape-determining protein MreC n=1 Tax=Vagococcus elongatus TaxID=180344 RepID=A0A430B185_9ENTE|nr:rod shape-determining protein MreC [Vagococcus elongatus]RSU14103.1 rod shape-determining protein MreC [Vagococcus elongatus]